MANKGKKLDQESYKREEKNVFHGSEPEILKYIQTLVCFANFLGGEIIIKEVQNEDYLKSFFDAAVLEKKVNSYINPQISGIIAVRPYNKGKGVKIKIQKSSRSPHFYKIDGFFINLKNEKKIIFQRGSIGIRRSGENDVFNSKDFESLFKKKFSEIFRNVQKIVTRQPLETLMETMGGLKTTSSESVRYKYDPSNPAAVSIKQILDREPFTNVGEELNASAKLWKTNGTLLSEELIAKSYLNADKINNDELIELLLLSSLGKQMPAYIWATKIRKPKLRSILINVIKRDSYPLTREAIKLVLVLPYKSIKKMINPAKSSRYISVTSLVEKIFNKINFKSKDRMDDIKKALSVGSFQREINIEDKNALDNLIKEFLNSDKKLRGAIKHDWRIFDLLLYGGKLLKN